MSTIKSFSVGFGDMFYIEHNSQNFTIIDCFLNEESTDVILDQIGPLSKSKEITRFISTHPDDDHIRGLELLDDRIVIRNFYCVHNKVTKEDQTDSFDRYCELRDSDKAFYIFKGCRRKWMNLDGDGRGSSGVNILWPDRKNQFFKEALADAEAGGSPNNISAVIKYSLEDGVKALWFGDLHKDFLELIENDIDTSPVDIVFAPHHGRRTGRIPTSMLKKLSPTVVVLGEAATEHLDHYVGYNTIPQNITGDVIFECVGHKVHVYTSKSCSAGFLAQENVAILKGVFYLGTFQARQAA
jgi:beta-lactamase superfamily II metal-dependent hydrolase